MVSCNSADLLRSKRATFGKPFDRGRSQVRDRTTATLQTERQSCSCVAGTGTATARCFVISLCVSVNPSFECHSTLILPPSSFSDLVFLMSGRSSCPECGTILRIRDRTFVGRRVSCPECKTTLRIESEDDRGGFVTRQLTAGELAAIEQSHRAANAAKGSPNKVLLSPPPARSFIGRLIDSPLTAAWMLAIAVSSLIAVLALAPKSRFTAARPVPAT